MSRMFWSGAARSSDSSERIGFCEFPRACWSEPTGESARLAGNCLRVGGTWHRA